MATRTVSSGGGNWNSLSTWAEGAVPTSVDDVVFTVSSGNLTVNVAATCKSINFTNYLSAITFNNTITVVNDVNFGTSSYSVFGNPSLGLSINGTSTITPGPLPFPCGIQTISTSIITLASDFYITGNAFLNGGIINSNKLYLAGAMQLNTTNNVTGTVTIVLNGNSLWSQLSTGQLRTNLTIDTTGTTTISGNVYYNTGVLSYSAGTVITTGSTLNIAASATISTNGMSWNNVNLGGTSTITLGNNMTINGLLTLGTTTLTTTINGNTIISSGGVTLGGTSSITKGTTNLKVTGGTLTGSNVNIPQLRLNLEIAGNVTFANGTTFQYNTGTLTYTSGVVTTTNSVLSNTGISTTYACSGITWYDFYAGAGTLTLNQDINVSSLLSLSNSTGIVTLTGVGKIYCSGSYDVGGAGYNNTTSYVIGGEIIMNGTGTIKSNGLTNKAAQCRSNLTINSPSGTITFSGNVVYNTGTLKYISGNVITTGSTIGTNGISTTYECSGITWNNFFAGFGTLTLNQDLYVSTLLSFAFGTSTLNLTGVGKIYCSGSFDIGQELGNNTSSIIAGGEIIMNGTGIIKNNGTTNKLAQCRSNLTINSPSGTITFSGNVIYNTGTLKHIAGTVITTGSSLTNYSVNTTYECSGITWDTYLAAGSTITLNQDLNVFNSLQLANTTTTLTISGVGKLYCGGNFDIGISSFNNTTAIISGGEIVMNGTGVIKNNGTTNKLAQCRSNLTINTTGTTTFSGNVFYNTGNLTFSSGTVVSSGGTINLGNPSVSNTFLTNQLPGLNITNINLSGNSQFEGTQNLSITNLSSSNTSGTRTINYSTGNTITVTSGLTLAGTISAPILFKSSTSGVKSKFNFIGGNYSLQDVGYVNATDIDSSGGDTIWSYNSTLSNTDNWKRLLPPPSIVSVS